MVENNKQVRVENWPIFFHQRVQLFYKKATYCDLTLQFEGNFQVKVHRLVMSVCTEYFEKYFQYLQETCSQINGNVIIMPKNLQAQVLVPIINFMYTGKLEFDASIFDQIYNAAELMKITILLKLLDSQRDTLQKQKLISTSGMTQVPTSQVPPILRNSFSQRLPDANCKTSLSNTVHNQLEAIKSEAYPNELGSLEKEEKLRTEFKVDYIKQEDLDIDDIKEEETENCNSNEESQTETSQPINEAMDDAPILSLFQKRKYSKDSSVDATESTISTLRSDSQNVPSQDHIVKRHQPSYTFKEKLAILKKLENEPVNIVSKEINVDARTLRRWKNQRSEIEAMSKKENISNYKKKRSPANTELEDALYIWFLQARTSGIPISGTILKRKAIEINDELGGDKSVKASDGWLDKWKHRKDIRSLKVTGEKRSADFDAGNDYVKKLKITVTNKTLDRAQVFNFDETSLLYKTLPSMTLASKHESQAAGFKSSKERVTVAACCNADGSFKLPLLVIGKSAKPRCLKDLSMVKLPVTYKSQKIAWMDVKIFTEWFEEIFVPNVRTFLANKNLPPRAILLVDNCKAHTYLKDGDIEVNFLPANVTSIIQPLDQGILETEDNTN